VARTYVKLPDWDLASIKVSGGEAIADMLVLNIRDTLRTALDSNGEHTNWIVSDVVKWTGLSTNKGYAFLIRHMDGEVVPAPTGHEWLFVLPGSGSSPTLAAEIEEILGAGSDPTIAQYFIEVNGSTTFGTDGDPAVHYNPTAIATPYGGGWDADGVLIGGDLSAPANNPYTNLDDFMPGTSHPVGLSFLSFSLDINYWSTVWDDEKPFMALYYTRGQESYIGGANIWGNVIIPYLASDTYTIGGLYFALSNSQSLGGSIVSNTVAMYTSTGARVVVTSNPIYAHSKYTATNSKTADGDYLWDLPIIIGSAGMKGYVDPDVMKVIGEYNGDYLKIFETNGVYYFKIQQAMAFPYVGNTPIFPPG